MIQNKRIGFLVASIHTGSAQSLFKPLVREASHLDSGFFIFPGGRLNSQIESDYLRNSIYQLVNKENFDGIVSWGSAIGSAVPVEELNKFHERFTGIPLVTIAHKMKNHPCVDFDAYSGMLNLVRHFIEEHKTTRIAFLRGPEFHHSANERFQAFCDIMKENGVDVTNSKLVSDPVGWTEGETAAVQLFNERGLIPGKDFEVLIGSSDMMTFSAISYLAKQGYKVPEDYKCGGFNDSSESRIIGTAFTTVHMPFRELGLTAVSMLKNVLNDGKTTADVMLASEVIIRESCGCKMEREINNQELPNNPKELEQYLTRLFRLDETYVNAILEPLIGALLSQETDVLFRIITGALERFFSENADIRLLITAIGVLKKLSFLPFGYISSLENQFWITVSKIQNMAVASKRYKDRRLNESLNSLKCGLLAAKRKIDLTEILAKYLPLIDINTFSIVLAEDDNNSRFIGGFSNGTLYTEEQLFSSTNLLPDNVKGFDKGVFLVLPLFEEKQPMGYIILQTIPYEGTVYEELRSAISSALLGAIMFEQTSIAKQRAEEAELAKTSFFANVGTDLCDPLYEINNKIEQIQKLLEVDSLDLDLLSGQMIFLKNRVDEQLEKTNLILELTKSQTNALPVEKRLFHMEDVIDFSEKTKKLPLVFGDPTRLRQALNIICKEWSLELSAIKLKKTDNGILISIETQNQINSACWIQNNMLLAEKIILLLEASMKKKQNGLEIIYPFPKFSCKNAIDSVNTFEWNADDASSLEWKDIYANRNKKEYVENAFLCISQVSDDELKKLKNFSAFFEHQMTKSVKNPIIFIGKDVPSYPLWAKMEQTVLVEDMTKFDEAIKNITPSMVVFEYLDVASVEKVRKNPATVLTPIMVLPEKIEDEDVVYDLSAIPRVILCNSAIAKEEEFATRVRAIFAGEEILPPDTGALVKKAICYLNQNSGSQISRWKLADSVHVSEDYLTRIFHKETGLSPWEYLNRYRINLASLMLLHTNATVYDVAEKCGFQDQAYFCRVFKKIHGVPPGKFRSKN